MANPALKFAPSGRWDAPSARPLSIRSAHPVHPAEIKVNNAISQCRDLLTDAEYSEVFEYSDRHGEYGLAIETLADILVEKEATPNRDQFNAIAEAFRFMNLDPRGRLAHLEGR